MSQLSAFEYIRRGQLPFFRLATAEPDETCDAVIVGVPWDQSVTYRSGARFAPWELRRASALIQTHHPVHRLDVFERLRAVDGGNIAIPPFDARAARSVIQTEATRVLESGAALFAVGGDHSISLPLLRAVREVHGPIAVVHVDAHFDTSSGELWGEDFHHGTPFRHALLEGLIAQDGLHQIGIRATWGSADEASFAADRGSRIYPMSRIDDGGIAQIACEIRESLGNAPFYLSFDIDAVDPAFAPGTTIPVAGGLTSRDAIRLMRGLAGANLVGMDLVEVCPSLDHADITLHLGAQLLYEGLALLALAKRQS
jgi:agmatinase